MKITILTLFPEMFQGPFEHSIIKRAIDKKFVTIRLVNIRDFGIGKHKIVDDTVYGGGVGMVMRVDVLYDAISSARDQTLGSETERIILLSAHGKPFVQKQATVFAKLSHLIFVCGHYEGVDERVKEFIDEEISIGDFITTGGEIPAMLITDAVIRHIKGVLKNDATANESFSKISDENKQLLENPQYTKPRVFKGKGVPEILLSGDHAKIALLRKQESLTATKKYRPDLLKN